MFKNLAFMFYFALIIVEVMSEDKGSLEKYCAHPNSAKIRKCVDDQGKRMVGDVGCGCAKKIKPNLYLHDDQARRDYFCEEATPEEQKEFEDCFNEGVEALNDDQVFKILNDCYNIA